MRVLLINPSNAFSVKTNLPRQAERAVSSFPPLGLMYLASSLSGAGHEARLLDLQGEDDIARRLEDEIRIAPPRLAGIYCSTFNLPEVMLIARLIKKADPRTHVCLGGPHLGVFPMETIALPGIDSVLRGEGEYAVRELADALETGKDLGHIRGLIFRRDKTVAVNEPPVFLRDLDLLAFPARNLAGSRTYRSLFFGGEPVTGMLSSRGCDHRCSFCSREHLGDTVRLRSPENVVAEIRECLAAGIRNILFYDENFVFDKERTRRICGMIKAEKLKFRWQIKSRVDLIDAEILGLLAEAGCAQIHFGAESGNDRVLRALQKDITTRKVREVARLCRDAGIKTLFYFLIGSPGETARDVRETVDFAVSLDPDYVHFSILVPFPGTKVYADALRDGLIEDYWSGFAREPSRDLRLRFLPGMKEAELRDFLKYAYRKFYLRPGYIVKRLMNPSEWKGAASKMASAGSLLKFAFSR